MRKGIAKILTVLNEKRRAAAKNEWKGKKYTPKDLRYKGTKASRRGLSKHQAALKTTRAQKKADNFKLRKYAVANWAVVIFWPISKKFRFQNQFTKKEPNMRLNSIKLFA